MRTSDRSHLPSPVRSPCTASGSTCTCYTGLWFSLGKVSVVYLLDVWFRDIAHFAAVDYCHYRGLSAQLLHMLRTWQPWVPLLDIFEIMQSIHCSRGSVLTVLAWLAALAAHYPMVEYGRCGDVPVNHVHHIWAAQPCCTSRTD